MIDGLVLAVVVIALVAFLHHFITKREDGKKRPIRENGESKKKEEERKEGDRDARRLKEYEVANILSVLFFLLFLLWL